MNRILLMVISVLALLLLAVLWRNDRLQNKYHQAKQTGDTYRVTLNNIQRRQISLAQLDEQKTRQLQEANDENEQLRRDILRGARRVRVHAACPATAAPAAPGVDDAAAARLTADAEQHYLYLRRQIVLITAQVTGLQQYIQTQCTDSKFTGEITP